MSVEPCPRAISGARDLGDVIVTPGFINAHTHLELTEFRGQVPARGSFIDWIADLVRLTADQTESAAAESLRDGLRQSLSAGVTTVADIGHGRSAVENWLHAPLNVVGFLEVLGMGSRRHGDHPRGLPEASRLLQEETEHEATGGLNVVRRLGLSAHAPYSTDTSVYDEALAAARRWNIPLTTHLAETPEERQFLTNGTGPFRELLERWGLWDGSFTPPGCSPVAYAHRLGLLDDGVLLAHVNDVTDDDLDLLAAGRSSVVYCPRTHRFFDRDPHRWADMVARGINVCVGTDSLASNDSLSILAELRHLRREAPAIAPDQILAMGTIRGASALFIDTEVGSIESGKRADLIIIPPEHAGTREPIAELLDGAAMPVGVYLDGHPITLTDPSSREQWA